MAGNMTRIIPVQCNSTTLLHHNHPLTHQHGLDSHHRLRTFMGDHHRNSHRTTRSQSLTWEARSGTGKGWSTSSSMPLNLHNLSPCCVRHACNNCGRSACAASSAAYNQMPQPVFNPKDKGGHQMSCRQAHLLCHNKCHPPGDQVLPHREWQVCHQHHQYRCRQR